MADRPCTHACPGCGVQVAYHRLACTSCWDRLPPELQAKVTGAWRQRRQRPGDGEAGRRHLLAFGEASRWLRKQAEGSRP